jgi:hypothetical protein
METSMLQNESVIAVFGDYQGTDVALKKLTSAGFAFENLSVVGKSYHSEEKAVGFYDTGDRIKFWGKRGTFWSGSWHLFAGGVALTMPGVGQIMVLGYLATIVVSAVDGAIMVGGLSALGAALYSSGIPRDSILQYEQAVKADGFLLVVHGAVEELVRARAILALGNPSRLDLHDGATTSMSGPLHAFRAPAAPSLGA